MSDRKQKPSRNSLIFSAVAIIIVIGIAAVSKQDGGEPPVTVSDEQIKPRLLPQRVVDGPTPTSPAPVAEAPEAEKDDTDVPEEKSVADALDFDGRIARIYAVAEEDRDAGNRLMRELADSVIKEYSLDEQVAWVEDLPDGLMKGAAAARVIHDWGKDNAGAALQWAQSLDQGARGSALSAAFAKWGAGVGGADRARGAEMIEALENERDRDFALNGYASGLLTSAPELALELAGSIANPKLRSSAVARLTQQIARKQEEQAE
jgi:hypothetical protein